MNRRQSLAGGISVGVGVLAGCPSAFGDESTAHKPQLEVFVTNALDESYCWL
jgi:hypothetical protein